MTNLETIRRNRNLQQQDVADDAGVPQATISRIERGKGATLKSAMKIARALNLSVEEVFGDVADAAPDDEPEAAGDEPVFSDLPVVPVLTAEEKARFRARLAERRALDEAEAAKRRVA